MCLSLLAAMTEVVDTRVFKVAGRDIAVVHKRFPPGVHVHTARIADSPLDLAVVAAAAPLAVYMPQYSNMINAKLFLADGKAYTILLYESGRLDLFHNEGDECTTELLALFFTAFPELPAKK